MKLHGVELVQGTVIQNANIESGSILPDAETTKGQIFFRTEDDTLYIRNAENSAWNSLGNYTLEGLSDVEVGGAEHGQSLVYDEISENWKPGQGGGGEGATFLNELADVDVSETTIDGLVLGYNDSTGNWEGVDSTGSVSVLTNNVLNDGTVTHNDGNGVNVTISLKARDLPFLDDTGIEPVLNSETVKDALLEVKDIAVNSTAISVMADNMATDGTIAHNDGNGVGVVIDLNADSIPFESAYSPSEIESDNVRDAIDEAYQLAADLFIREDTTLYISPAGSPGGGNDETGDGTEDNPWATPHKAFDHLNDKIIGEGAIVTIECDEGDYVFNEPIVVRSLQGNQIQLIGKPLVGNKPMTFKLPDFTDPLNPTQDPRDIDDLFTSAAAMSIDATEEDVGLAVDNDMINNKALIYERIPTRFFFDGGGVVGVQAIVVEDGCGISLVDNILFEGEWIKDEGNWDLYMSDGVIQLKKNSYLQLGSGCAIMNFCSYAFRVTNNSNLVTDKPLVLNSYSTAWVASGGIWTGLGWMTSHFTDSSDVPESGTFYIGRNGGNQIRCLENGYVDLYNVSFIGGIGLTSIMLAKSSSNASLGNICVAGSHMYNHSKIGLFECLGFSKITFDTYDTYITGIGGSSSPYIMRCERGELDFNDLGRSDFIVKGCKPNILYATDSSKIRLFWPTFTSNENAVFHVNDDSFFMGHGTWILDDTNTNISLNVSNGSRITIPEPGTSGIDESAVLNTAWSRLTRDGSYIGLTALDSGEKKWQFAEDDMTVVDGDRILVSADSNDVTITLPATPKDDDEVMVRLVRNNNGVNSVHINPSTKDINDISGISNVADILHRDVTLVYHTFGWWATGGNVSGGTY
jgi:hypothetical protein